MYETWDTQKRIAEAKRLTACAVDHLQYLLDIHESNAVVLNSDTLSKQIPKSYAANAFNVFREAMHQIELVRICALWDRGNYERESIVTVIDLIDDERVLEALADQARAGHHEEFGKQQAEKARASLKSAIKMARETHKSERLRSIRNLRDKHVAHYLTETVEEKKGPVTPMKHGDEVPVIDAAISVVETLNSWVNQVGLSFKDARTIDHKCANALWGACSFKIDTE